KCLLFGAVSCILISLFSAWQQVLGDARHCGPAQRVSMSKKQNQIQVPPSDAKLDISKAPTLPGCYLMRDADGNILYIGKAKNLRARLRNYINMSDSRYSVRFLMRRVAGIEYLTVDTEKEALLLENSLIKTHKPHYNVRLRDDKTYISIRLDPSERFPRLTVVHRRKPDKARYFGPYHDARAARKTIKQLQYLIPLRICSDHVLASRKRPCIYYQMKQCPAPCTGLIPPEAYADMVNQVLMILEGRSKELEKQLRARMARLSEALCFEEAAQIRDRLADLRITVEPQRAIVPGPACGRDVFGYYAEGQFLQIQSLYYRNNAMVGGDTFAFDRVEVPLEELFASFLLQYYDSAPFIPGEILLPSALEEMPVLEELLSEKRGAPVRLRVPRRGPPAHLVQLAESNAQRAFIERKGHEKAVLKALEAVQDTLHLPRLPGRIECFDVSTIQGDSTVAAMVVFEQGVPAKNRYRRYTIKDTPGQDDFAAMRETLLRRYTRALRENDLPDLVLIDGGKGHLNVASAVLKTLGLESLPHAAIAKSRSENGQTSCERFFIPRRSNPIVPPQNGPVVHLLSAVRDETHRFAITFHRKKRSQARLTSTLLEIPGVGKTRLKRLLTTFGSVTRLREASVEQVAALPSINDTLARQIVEFLKQNPGRQ
ncbi:MAG TPA: excinuclease ABC subunit UvrC, partial [Candidatus Hydrogenedentes bacterium]|nr:excinuclease ABC subunit UvrC [Candidatus Hydrogenedentota bacterium]